MKKLMRSDIFELLYHCREIMSIIFNLGFKFHIVYEVIEMVSVFNNAQALENVGT